MRVGDIIRCGAAGTCADYPDLKCPVCRNTGWLRVIALETPRTGPVEIKVESAPSGAFDPDGKYLPARSVSVDHSPTESEIIGDLIGGRTRHA